MARRGRFPKTPKAPRKKAASYTLVDPQSEQGQRAYAMLKDLIEEFHEELTNARVCIAWNHTWKPDVDGRCKIGHCKKAGDLDRELAPYDFAILLRHDFWTSVVVTDEQRRALLDHELCYATVKYDKAGEPAVDERGRTIYRIRKHDIEEFTQIVERHGRYTRDLENFYAAMKRGGTQGELFEMPKSAKVAQTPKEQLAQVAAAAGEVKPSEPHRFEPTGAKGLASQMCTHCGAGEADPVHETASATIPGVGDVTVTGPNAAEIVKGMAAGNGKGRGPIARARTRPTKASRRKKRPEARA